jgi:hypothetical protein
MRGLRLTLLGLFLLPLFAMPASPARADDPIGQVKTATGDVTVLRAGVAGKLATGDHVFAADVIATGHDGSVGITFAANESRPFLRFFTVETGKSDRHWGR